MHLDGGHGPTQPLVPIQEVEEALLITRRRWREAAARHTTAGRGAGRRLRFDHLGERGPAGSTDRKGITSRRSCQS